MIVCNLSKLVTIVSVYTIWHLVFWSLILVELNFVEWGWPIKTFPGWLFWNSFVEVSDSMEKPEN